MASVSNFEALVSLGTRGTFGFSCGLGRIRLGLTRLGYFSEFAGIYQRHRVRGGWGISRMTFYRTSNPQTPVQQAWRSIFAAGWAVYNSLTPDEKALLSKQARKRGLTGANLFMSRWLQSHRS